MIMKNAPLPLILSVVSCLAVSPAIAANFTGTPTGNQNWENVSWSPSGGPGAGDTITDLLGASTYNVFLNGDRTLAELRKTSNNNKRFYNGASDAGDAATASTFTIGLINVLEGGYLFRSHTGGSLTVDAGVTRVGNAGVADDATPNAGGLTIGSTSDKSSNVAFTTGRLELYQRANVTVEKSATETPTVDFGHIIYKNTSNNLTQILLGPTAGATDMNFRVKAASLSTAASPIGSDRVLLRGTGVLELYGNLGDPGHPGGTGGAAAFEGLIQDAVRVEKTGSAIQVFSRAGGNTYSGGTLISGGVLSIRSNISSALGKGEVLVTDTGALAGNGIVVPIAGKEIIVRNGGRLAPSADLSTTAQRLRLDARNHGSNTFLRVEEGGRFDFQLFETGNDEIALLNYSEGNFLITAADGAYVDISGEIREGVYTLFTFHAGDENSALVASGLLDGLQIGSGFDGYTATFHYDDVNYGGVGTIALELQAIPEPGQVTLLLLAGGIAFGRFVHTRRRTTSL